MIERTHITAKHSRTVKHAGVVYLAGIAAADRSGSLAEQTKEIFRMIEKSLADSGSSVKHLLSAQVWLKDIADASVFNSLWEAWIPQGHAPARAMVQARLASEDMLVEVMVVAAVEE